MLQKIRDNSQGFLAKIFVGFIVLVFALFGAESLVGTFTSPSTQLIVNGEDIDIYEIDSLTQRKSQEFFRNLGEDADFSAFDESMFRESAINELIQRELLRQSASNSGMAISSAAVDQRIVSTPDFLVDGVYNDERAGILLQSMGYSPAGYRAVLEEELLLNQILAAYSSSGFATHSEIDKLVKLLHQQRDFRYISISLDAQSSDMEISEQDITDYYGNNQAEFMREEQIQITFLELNKENMFDEVSVSEADVRQKYDEETAAYQAQTERRAAHILFEAASDEEIEKAEQEAADVFSRIEAGEDFASLAAEFSDDLGSAEEGGDVGYTTGDSFVPEFEEALQSLSLNEVSAPVKTEFGFHLIKLNEITETEITPYEQRRDDIERDLKASEVNILFLARSEELSNLAFESFDLVEPANIMGLELQESGWFGRTGGTGITAMTGVINAAFSAEVLEDQLNSDLIQLDENRVVVIHAKDHRLSEVLPLEEVRGEITINLRLEQMQQQARQLGDTIVSNIENGYNIDSLLETQGLSWTELDGVKRDDQRINPAITEQVFSMSDPVEGSTTVKGFALPNGEYVVIELQAVRAGTAEDAREGELDSLRDFVSQQASALDFSAFMLSMEGRADIVDRNVLVDEEF